MGNNNCNLQTAKNAKDDEFYTTYETVQKELSHYVKHFNKKTVLCNCDDPFKSNFCRYFIRNFNVLGLKRLICTSYVTSDIGSFQTSLFENCEEPQFNTRGYVLDLKKVPEKANNFSDKEIESFLFKSQHVQYLYGNGDFSNHDI